MNDAGGRESQIMSGAAKTTLAAFALFVVATPALSDEQPHQSGLLIDLFKIAVAETSSSSRFLSY